LSHINGDSTNAVPKTINNQVISYYSY